MKNQDLKKIIENLENELEQLLDLIQSREYKVDDISTKWQESEKCEEWMDKTMEIEEQADELYIIIDNLKELV